MALGAGRRLLRGRRASRARCASWSALVESARDGIVLPASVAVRQQRRDRGVWPAPFNRLLADLREKRADDRLPARGHDARSAKGAGVTGDEYGTAITASLTAASCRATGPMDPGRTSFAGRYEVLETLGKGGMGVVYRARDRQLDEEVALEVLRQDVLQEDPTLLDRFKQELKLARRHHAPQRAAHARFRASGRRHPLHLDGVPGGRDAQGPDRAQQGRAAHWAWACASPSRCATAWRPHTPRRVAPRRQAAEHADPARRRASVKIMDFRHRTRLRGAARRVRSRADHGRDRDGDA